MKRVEFLKKLRKRLSFLSKVELEQEVLHYINEIDKSKKNDEEVIKNFGSIEDIVKKVCASHGIDYKRVAKKSFFSWFTSFYEAIQDFSSIFKNSDNRERIKLIGDLLLLILITCVLKIPFIFIRNLGDSLIETFFQSNISFLAIWGLIIEILYVFIALSFFINTLKKWVNNIEEEVLS